MKKFLALLTSLLIISSVAFSQNQGNLVGTWKLISGKLTNKDSVTNYDMANLHSIKIVTATHFAVFTHGENNSFEHAQAGKVRFDGKNYTESIEYGSFTQALGQDMNFTYELKGDKWHIMGGGIGYLFDENWERVK